MKVSWNVPSVFVVAENVRAVPRSAMTIATGTFAAGAPEAISVACPVRGIWVPAGAVVTNVLSVAV